MLTNESSSIVLKVLMNFSKALFWGPECTETTKGLKFGQLFRTFVCRLLLVAVPLKRYSEID